jgi:hypothetical protein
MNEVDKHGIGSPKVDLDTYDYNALSPTITAEREWVIQLESMGFVDGAGNPVDPDGAHSSTGVQPTFILYCYDDTGAYRITHECTGLPDSKTILQCVCLLFTTSFFFSKYFLERYSVRWPNRACH